MVHGYGDRAEFVEENFSDSVLAKKFGIRFYPAVFVNEVLIAKPSDFFGNTTGRYIPWREPKNQEKFRADLKRMIEIAFQDGGALAKEGVAPDTSAPSAIAVSMLVTPDNAETTTSTRAPCASARSCASPASHACTSACASRARMALARSFA